MYRGHVIMNRSISLQVAHDTYRPIMAVMDVNPALHTASGGRAELLDLIGVHCNRNRAQSRAHSREQQVLRVARSAALWVMMSYLLSSLCSPQRSVSHSFVVVAGRSGCYSPPALILSRF